MREWLNRHAWKACVAERLPRVRIPPLPHAYRPIKKEIATKIEGVRRSNGRFSKINFYV